MHTGNSNFIFSLLTAIGKKIAVNPRIPRMLNILEPTTFPIATSALPCRAPIKLTTSSGIEVPTPTMAAPITKSDSVTFVFFRCSVFVKTTHLMLVAEMLRWIPGEERRCLSLGLRWLCWKLMKYIPHEVMGNRKTLQHYHKMPEQLYSPKDISATFSFPTTNILHFFKITAHFGTTE